MPATSVDAPPAVAATLSFGNAMSSLSDFLFSGVLVRFPNLKLAYSEGQIGWIPYILERVDDVWREHRAWGGVKDIVPDPPSTYYYRQVYGCFFRDVHGLESLRARRRRQHHVRDRLPAHRLDLAPHEGAGRADDGGPPAGRRRQDLPGQRHPHAEPRPLTVPERLIPLDGPANFRDLGGYETHHGTFVRPGRVFRSDSLSFMTDEDVRHVTEVLGLRTVIDLRRGQGGRAVHPRAARVAPDHGVAHADRGRDAREDEEHDRNAWANGEVIPLDELYLLMLDRFGHRFAAVLEIIAAGDTQPLVFHCAAGKDRTGLVAMLVLALLGVDPEIIAADYALTDARMPILLERHQARAEVEEGAVAEVAQQRWAVDATAMPRRHRPARRGARFGRGLCPRAGTGPRGDRAPRARRCSKIPPSTTWSDRIVAW